MRWDLVYSELPGPGWHPVSHMVAVAGTSLDVPITRIRPHRHLGPVALGSALLPRRSRRGRGVILVAATPRQLPELVLLARRARYETAVAWVIDSFWVDRIPSVAGDGILERVYVMDRNDVAEWAAVTRGRVSALPWGTDALGLGSAQPVRQVDLLRIGRQPAGWDDDDRTARVLAAVGVRYGGRPPMGATTVDNMRIVTRAFAGAKFTLAFSNLVSPAGYTHPTREYLTARWTDSLGSGATVVGCSPRTAAASDLLWPGATEDVSELGPAEASQALRALVAGWTPERALQNHLQARRRLDWRWRFKQLADDLDVRPARLDDELAELVSWTEPPQPSGAPA